MDNQSTQNTYMENLEIFFRERISILQQIQLSNLLQEDNRLPFLLMEQNVITLIRKLLNHYLDAHQGWWNELSLSPQFSSSPFLVNASPQLRFQYESAFGQAENRLIKQFAANFFASDHSIDWQKLLRSRSS